MPVPVFYKINPTYLNYSKYKSIPYLGYLLMYLFGKLWMKFELHYRKPNQLMVNSFKHYSIIEGKILHHGGTRRNTENIVDWILSKMNYSRKDLQDGQDNIFQAFRTKAWRSIASGEINYLNITMDKKQIPAINWPVMKILKILVTSKTA